MSAKPTVVRPKRLGFKIARDEREMLLRLAVADGLTSSDVLRLAIRRLHGERFGAATAGPEPRVGR
jgi:hypothetical protein